MLSYRHAFHAGNHADVLKHLVLVSILDYLQRKETAVHYVDSHAGRGHYALDDEFAEKLAEAQLGIARLLGVTSANELNNGQSNDQTDPPPAPIANYLSVVGKLNPTGQLTQYPGSPAIAGALLRTQDRAHLFELHPADSLALAGLFAKRKQIQVRAQDGLKGLNAVLPPPSRRGLVLIDPSYEIKAEYQQVVAALIAARRRFATGVYMVWYPQLARSELAQFVDQLIAAAGERWLHIGMRVRATPSDGFGMTGSGLVIVNPPYPLQEQMQTCLPWLLGRLGQDGEAGYWIDASGIDKPGIGSTI